MRTLPLIGTGIFRKIVWSSPWQTPDTRLMFIEIKALKSMHYRKPDAPLRSVAELLVFLIGERGWTQQEFAFHVRRDMDPSYVNRWLTGKRTPTGKNRTAIITALGMQPGSWDRALYLKLLREHDARERQDKRRLRAQQNVAGGQSASVNSAQCNQSIFAAGATSSVEVKIAKELEVINKSFWLNAGGASQKFTDDKFTLGTRFALLAQTHSIMGALPLASDRACFITNSLRALESDAWESGADLVVLAHNFPDLPPTRNELEACLLKLLSSDQDNEGMQGLMAAASLSWLVCGDHLYSPSVTACLLFLKKIRMWNDRDVPNVLVARALLGVHICLIGTEKTKNYEIERQIDRELSISTLANAESDVLIQAASALAKRVDSSPSLIDRLARVELISDWGRRRDLIPRPPRQNFSIIDRVATKLEDCKGPLARATLLCFLMNEGYVPLGELDNNIASLLENEIVRQTVGRELVFLIAERGDSVGISCVQQLMSSQDPDLQNIAELCWLAFAPVDELKVRLFDDDISFADRVAIARAIVSGCWWGHVDALLCRWWARFDVSAAVGIGILTTPPLHLSQFSSAYYHYSIFVYNLIVKMPLTALRALLRRSRTGLGGQD